MNHATRNYISYILASFIIFFDVLVLAKNIFTEDLPIFVLILNIALLLGLFVTWRARNFARKSASYGFAAATLMILLNILMIPTETFWLTLIVNLVILILLILVNSVLAPPKPLPTPLKFGQETPHIDQEFAKRFREKIRINATDHVLLLYGKPEKQKQFHLLIRALPTLLELFPDDNIRLLITTWGENDRTVKKLKRLVQHHDLTKNVRFIKTTNPEHLKYTINLADVIVFPYNAVYRDPEDLNAVLPYLKALVVPDTALFGQLINDKNCLKVVDMRNKNLLAITIENLLKNDQLLLQLGFNLSSKK